MYKLPDTLTEDIVKLGILSKDYQDKKIETVQFKAYRVPMGIYEQRKDEVYMVRIRTTGGVIYPEQLLQVMDIARRHKSDLLHITTRQEIQIQNLNLEEVEPILYELQEIGLSSKGGGGNTVRNILVSVNSGVTDEEVFDTTPHAMALTTKLIAEFDSYLLPRKLKIAFSSNDQQIDYAAINDLGLIAKVKDGVRGFKVYAGGGGGAKPTVGWVLFEFIPESELFAVAEALKKMFSEHGNRKNKHKARIRYIFYKLGEAETLRLIRGYYEEARKTTPKYVPEAVEAIHPFTYTVPKDITPDQDFYTWKKRYALAQKQKGYSSVLVPFTSGNIPLDNAESVDAVEKLLHFVSRFGKNTLRFTPAQNIQLRNIPTAALPELHLLLKNITTDIKYPVLVNTIVSCTGADTCRLGIGLSKGLAAAVRRKLLSSALDLDKLADARIRISGCPNSCGQQLWADIGFSGKVLRNDRVYPGYQVYLAANRKDKPHLAEAVGNISARDIPEFLVRLLASYLKVQSRHASLTDYLEKNGKKRAVKLLSEYAEIPSFAEDKNYYFDWGSEALFSVVSRGVAECSTGLFDMIDVDSNTIRTSRALLEKEKDPEKQNSLLYDILYSASRMLLVTRGAEPKTTPDTFNLFISHFIESGLVGNKYLPVVELARDNKQADFNLYKDTIHALSDTVIELYKNMDDSLQFKNVS
ncbi:Sulfite reductase [ferredoxin] [Bacteroidales bacterium Barb7]|nr:Sulfite reductase [ferredoxin] [Bacteroidales bacterium Barb7]